MMCRLAEQKSIYEVLNIVDQISKSENAQLLIIGNPADINVAQKVDDSYYSRLENVFIHRTFAQPKLQHRVLAASDAILQPSKWGPCGYTQLEGMVYGAVPIVTNIGGHRNTVVPFNSENLSGYGITIEKPTSELILKSIQRAAELFQDKGMWKVAVMNAVNEDFTWSGKRDSVGNYISLYERIAEKRAQR